MPDEAITVEPAESTADEKKSPAERLPELLADWDEHKRPASEPAGLPADVFAADTTEFEDRIATLEADNATLTERTEKAEGMGDIFDRAMTHVDQRDFDELTKKLVSETSMSKRVAVMEVEKRYREDEDFAAAADDRFDEPEHFASKVVNWLEDLVETYPQTDNDHGLTAAVRMSRSVGGATYGARHYGDFSKMNTHEFAAASKEVFEDAEAGKLQPSSGGYRGGFISTRSAGS